MRRGHGEIQRWVLDQVRKRPEEVQPVVALASTYASDKKIPNTPRLRASFCRAVSGMNDPRDIRVWEVKLPTGYYGLRPAAWRWMICVTSPGVAELTAGQHSDACRAMYELSLSQQLIS